MPTFEIQYATTAEQSLYSQISHLEPYIGFDGAEKKLSSLITSAEALLSKNPFAYPVRPTKEDADEMGNVLVYDSLGWYIESYQHCDEYSAVSHWMKLPDSPVKE